LKLELQRLLADQTLERRDPGFVLLEEIGGQIRIRFRQTSWRLAGP
jgi:hypothetical protein